MAIPKPVKELTFKVIREEWWRLHLEDGSIIRIKPVLIRCVESDQKDPITGKNILGFESQNVLAVNSPDKLKGPPSPSLPDPPTALKSANKEEVRIVKIEEPSGEHYPGWNLYEIVETGEQVKAKLVPVTVYRIKGYFDRYGNPYYVVQSSMVWGSAPLMSADALTVTPLHSISPSYRHPNPIEFSFSRRSQLEPISNKFEPSPFISPPSICLLYTSPSPRDLSTSRMPSSA